MSQFYLPPRVAATALSIFCLSAPAFADRPAAPHAPEASQLTAVTDVAARPALTPQEVAEANRQANEIALGVLMMWLDETD